MKLIPMFEAADAICTILQGCLKPAIDDQLNVGMKYLHVVYFALRALRQRAISSARNL